MTKYTPVELVTIGHAIEAVLGHPPSRDDLRGETKKKIEASLGFALPSPTSIEKAFGSWSDYRLACGWPAGVGGHLGDVERAAVQHCVSELGITEEAHETSITDGWYPDGRTVEIKGSVLRQHNKNRMHFFGWRLHSRQLSISADELILVGLSRDLEPIVRLQIPRAALEAVIDGKSNATLYANAVWGTGDSKLRRFVAWRKGGTLNEAQENWSSGLPSER